MRDIVRPVAILSVIMLVIVIPFLVYHERIERWWLRFEESPPSIWTTVAVVVGLLASDIFLPIPSSAISTFAGVYLGWFLGGLASTIGMSVGCVIAFALAKRFGVPLAERLSKPRELAGIRELSMRFGPFLLFVTRGAPVFAEAGVLFMGAHGLPWRRFLLPILAANLLLSFFYSIFGEIARQYEVQSLAVAISIVLPVLLVMLLRYILPRST